LFEIINNAGYFHISEKNFRVQHNQLLTRPINRNIAEVHITEVK